MKIADMCDDYKITNQPQMPIFSCPEGETSETYLKKICEKNFPNRVFVNHDEYHQRLARELNTFNEVEKLSNGQVSLNSYFLLDWEIVKWIKSNGWVIGPGRGCLKKDTKIFLENGIVKDIKDVTIGDRVLTKTGKFHKVINNFKYNIDKEELLTIYTYYGDSVGVSLTRDHKVLAEKLLRPDNWDSVSKSTRRTRKSIKEPVGNLKWLRSDELGVGDWVFIPKQKTDCTNEIVIDFSKYCNNIELFADDHYVHHIRFNPLTKQVAEKRKFDRFLKLDNDLFCILGMFLGNGWFKKNAIDVGIAFNSEHLSKINFVKDKLKSIGLDFKERISKSSKLCQLVIKNKFFRLWMGDIHQEYVRTAQSKYVPNIIFQTNEECLSSYLKGYFLTDGHFGKNKMVACSSSYRLIQQIRLLLWKIGLPASLRKETRLDQRKSFKGLHTAYYINVPHDERISGKNASKNYRYRKIDNGILVQIRKINTCYVDVVYDLEVEKEHNYTTTSFLVHNSAAGCLTAYLLGITNIDPIQADLSFERFYNAGRNQPGRIALPDIDIDIQKTKRDQIIDHIKNKYGNDKVAQLATFGRMQGRKSLGEVLRAYGKSFEERNIITKFIPDEASIADDLQEMREEYGSSSIIQWALENEKKLHEWCKIEKNELVGDYAFYFKQAIQLEGVKIIQGKHASAIIISPTTLANFCPMIYDKNTKSQVVGYELNDAEAAGLVKYDFLGISTLDRIQGVSYLLRTGEIPEDL